MIATHRDTSALKNLLLPALTIVFVVAVQAWHFHDRPYRQDEAWVVHYALENIERAGVFGHVLQVFRQLPPENALQDIWIYFFGHTENIVRYFSTLVTVIALSLCYRLTADLFDRHSGWLALTLLGTYSIFVFYSHEARPYAALALGAIGFQWALLRFIRRPNRGRAAMTLLLGVLPFYLHPFMIYVFVAQLLCVLLIVRWDRDLYRRGAMLVILLALLVGARAWINFADRSATITYNLPAGAEGVAELYDHFRANPEILGLFLFLGGVTALATKLVAPFRGQGGPLPRIGLARRMRFAAGWRESWLALALLLMVGLAWLVNASVPSLTPRNLLIAAPTLVLFGVIGLRQLPRQAQLLALLFLCVPFVTQFRSHSGNAGYWEMAEYVEQHYERERDRLVIVASQAWEWIAINYFLQERTDIGFVDGDIFYVSWEQQDKDRFGPTAVDEDLYVQGFAADDGWEKLRAYLGERDRLWVITGNPYPGGRNMLDAIEAGYTMYQAATFPGETYYRALEIRRYQRHPEVAKPRWRFGEQINVLDWRMLNDHRAQPCQTVSVATWWSSAAELEDIYSSTLVIVDERGQGIVNADNVPGGIYMTSIWQPDRPYYDLRELKLPCDLAAGEYPLLLGLYMLPDDLAAGVENLQVYSAEGEPTGRDIQYLTTLVVEG